MKLQLWMVLISVATFSILAPAQAARRLTREHAETVASELPSGYEILRRCRNAGGHPDVPGDVDADTVFLNLRSFTEYARRTNELIAYFTANAADW